MSVGLLCGRIWVHALSWDAPLLRSADGVSWELSPVNAFCRNITLTNGSVAELARRERPKLIFDASGAPTHLVSSAAWGGAAANGDATFTFIQPLQVAGGEL